MEEKRRCRLARFFDDRSVGLAIVADGSYGSWGRIGLRNDLLQRRFENVFLAYSTKNGRFENCIAFKRIRVQDENLYLKLLKILVRKKVDVF